MPPHPHGWLFNMELCLACEENCVSHTETDAEKQADDKSELHSSAELWKPKRRHTHIKNKNKLNLNKK
jgi:apolipoprotein N-acyltransferase